MPELSWATVVSWLVTHGIPILIIVVVGVVLWFVVKRFLPRIVGRAVTQTGYKEKAKRGWRRGRIPLYLSLEVWHA
jgi:hypothetical protein